MKILVIGKSAREHAFIENIANNYIVPEIFCTPGNPAIAQYANCTNIAMDDMTSMVEFAKENAIDLTVVFDEELIEKGIANIFNAENLKIFAPSKEAAQIATSRAFSKKFLYKQKIPVAKYGVFDKESSGLDFLKKINFPVKISLDYKSDGDSFVCKTFNNAKNLLAQLFADGQKRIIIEEHPDGEEFEITILTDGYTVLPLAYLKLSENIAYTPVNAITEKIENDIAQKIIFPLLDGLQNQQNPYIGFLTLKFLLQPNNKVLALDFAPSIGLMQSTCIFQLLESDILRTIFLATQGALEDNEEEIYLSDENVISTTILAPKAFLIADGIENIDDEGIELYYNEVGMDGNYNISTNGEKAFLMTAKASTLNNAKELLDSNRDIINFRTN